MPSTFRIFLATEIDEVARDRISRFVRELTNAGEGVKWVERENLHYTLKFLGDVPVAETPRIVEAATEVVAGLPSFDLEIHGLGAFPTTRRPRTIWVGARQGADRMVELQRRVDRALKKLRYPPEDRRFIPHLTIGRVRSPGQAGTALGEILAAKANESFGIVRVCEIVVFASFLDRTGPTYQTMGRSPLTGGVA